MKNELECSTNLKMLLLHYMCISMNFIFYLDLIFFSSLIIWPHSGYSPDVSMATSVSQIWVKPHPWMFKNNWRTLAMSDAKSGCGCASTYLKARYCAFGLGYCHGPDFSRGTIVAESVRYKTWEAHWHQELRAFQNFSVFYILFFNALYLIVLGNV